MDFLQQQGIQVKVIPGMLLYIRILNLIIKFRFTTRAHLSVSQLRQCGKLLPLPKVMMGISNCHWTKILCPLLKSPSIGSGINYARFGWTNSPFSQAVVNSEILFSGGNLSVFKSKTNT